MPTAPRTARRNPWKPAPSPEPITVHIPAPPRAARPPGWTEARVRLAAPAGDTLTADAYVSPDGLTALHRSPGYAHEDKRRPRYVVGLVIAGKVWATVSRTTSRSAEVRPVAAAAATVHAAQEAQVKAIADLTPGGPAWKRAAKAMHAAYIAAGLA
jgi:hypothetical protein